VESTEPKQVYDVKLDFVSERTIKDHQQQQQQRWGSGVQPCRGQRGVVRRVGSRAVETMALLFVGQVVGLGCSVPPHFLP
jgi:hypothetical protein